MNGLQIFKYNSAEVRTVIKDDEPWFVLKDVCGVLGLDSPHKVAERLDEDERNQIPVTDGLGRSQETAVVNEAGLYNVIVRSDKPEAKAFRRWVTHEVLPSIRKHGGYLTDAAIEAIMNNPDNWITMLTALKAEREKRAQLESRVDEMRPKEIFADAVSVSEGAILIGELAKILRANGAEIGEKRLFEWLRQNGYLIKRRGTDYNAPTQRAVEMGLFRVKETAITHSDGHVTVSKTTKVTGRGQQYFINIFLKTA